MEMVLPVDSHVLMTFQFQTCMATHVKLSTIKMLILVDCTIRRTSLQARLAALVVEDVPRMKKRLKTLTLNASKRKD